MTRLNLGSGDRYLTDGWVNIDCQPRSRCDLILTLGVDRLPFSDGEVTEVEARHVMEHVEGFLPLMQELYRVMQPGAELRITVPYHFSDAFHGDPTHVRTITLAQLQLFSRAKCAEFKAKGWPNTPLADYLEIDFEVRDVKYELTPRWQARGLSGPALQEAIESYNNVVNEVFFLLVRV